MSDVPVVPGLVSVVVCAYQNWPDLEMTLESALHQSYDAVEIIVVDNGSADETPVEIPKRFGSRIRYIRQDNRGDAGAYNTGLRLARGEFIQFVDGDDILAPDKLDKQVACLSASYLDVIYGDIRFFRNAPGVANWIDVSTPSESNMLKSLTTLDWTGLSALGSLFRRSALETIGPWDENLYIADLDYWLRAAWAGCRFGRCEGSPLGFARRRPEQMSQNTAAMIAGTEAVWEKALTYVNREPYRGWIAAKLARHRLSIALRKNGMTTRNALRQLDRARAASADVVNIPIYVLARVVITTPGASALVKSSAVRSVRKVAARARHALVQNGRRIAGRTSPSAFL